MAAAVEMCGRFRAKLIAFRAVQIPVPTYMEPPAMTKILELLEGVGVEWEGPANREGAWQEVVRAAEGSEVDLIVLASHGYLGRDRVLGRKAGRIANLTQLNLFVVQESAPSGEP